VVHFDNQVKRPIWGEQYLLALVIIENIPAPKIFSDDAMITKGKIQVACLAKGGMGKCH
jgi:hypothetical protein